MDIVPEMRMNQIYFDSLPTFSPIKAYICGLLKKMKTMKRCLTMKRKVGCTIP